MFGALSIQRNFTTLDQVKSNSILTNLNRTFLSPASGGGATGTIIGGVGKTYIELTIDLAGAGLGIHVGIWNYPADIVSGGSYLGSKSGAWSYNSAGNKTTNATSTAYGATFTTGDNIGIMYDSTGGTLEFRKNGVSQGVAYSGVTANLIIAASCDTFGNQVGCTINCGATPFVYSVPSGYNPGLYS